MGDYKPPVNVYLNALFIKLFGLNEFAIRLPGVILGSLTVGVIYFLLGEFGVGRRVRLAGAIWLAVSPWHILYSRAGYEAVTALFFLSLGLSGFLRFVRRGGVGWASMSLFGFGLSVWSYHAERLYVPLVAMAMGLIFKREIGKWVKKWCRQDWITIGIIFLVLALPYLYLLLFTKGISARAVELLITKEMPEGKGFLWVIQKAFTQYLNYFDLRFVFSKALNLTPENYQDMGILNLTDLPIFVMGIYLIMTRKQSKRIWVVLVMLFLGPVPAALTRGAPSAIRILVWVPVLAVVFGLGFETLWVRYGRRFLLWFMAGSAFSLSYFGFLYTISFPNFYEGLWHYGYKEVSLYVCEKHEKYEKVIVTDKYGVEISDVKSIPHYYFLFYCRINPMRYQQDPRLFNVEFREIVWWEDLTEPNALIVGSPRDFPENFPEERIKDKIYFSNGKTAFYLVETRY